jgi:peptidoglycan/LPS O-acetylase OafA/YrhL
VGAAILIGSIATRYATMIDGVVLDEIWSYEFLGSTICFFMMGHLVCIAGTRWPPLARPRTGWKLLAGSTLIMFLLPESGFDDSRLWLSVILFTLALPGLFHATKNVRWMNLLGDLSYPVYLVHGIVLLVVGGVIADTIFAHLGTRLIVAHISALAFLAAVLLASIAAHVMIEKPITRRLRRRAQTGILPAGATP